MSKQAIYISYYFPPIHSVASIRNAHLVEELRVYFEQIDVITTENYKLFPKDEYLIEHINIHPLPTFDYRTILSKKSTSEKTIHHSEKNKSNPFISFLIKLNDSFPFNLLLGEGGLRYIYNGYAKASEIISKAEKSTEFTVFSSYRPSANIVIAYLLKRKFPAVRWVNNFHDAPHNVSNRPTIYERMQSRFWKRLLNQSTLNVTVSKGVATEIEVLNPRTMAIPNGVKISNSTANTNSKFTIAYTGSIYKSLQSPKPLFKVLTDLVANGDLNATNFQLIYAGKDGAIWKDFLADCPTLLPYCQALGNLTQKEVYSIQAAAHINLLLTWSSPGHEGILTGKLFAYLGVRNPILGIVNGSVDEEIDVLFDRLHCGQPVYTSDNDLHSKIHDFLLKHLSLFNNQDYLNALTPTSELEKMTWTGQVKQLMDALDKECLARTPNEIQA